MRRLWRAAAMNQIPENWQKVPPTELKSLREEQEVEQMAGRQGMGRRRDSWLERPCGLDGTSQVTDHAQDSRDRACWLWEVIIQGLNAWMTDVHLMLDNQGVLRLQRQASRQCECQKPLRLVVVKEELAETGVKTELNQ